MHRTVLLTGALLVAVGLALFGTKTVRYGIPIAHVLRVQATELREKRKQRAEERALKMPVKLVFPVVVCILPALFIVVAGPAAVRMSQIF